MTVKLKVLDGSGKGCIYVLGEGDSKVFGRHTSADIVIADPLLSRHHLMVRASAGSCVILDLDSSNGTFLNGQLVKEAPVDTGDRVRIGNEVFEVEIDRVRPSRGASPGDASETVKALRFCGRCHKAVLVAGMMPAVPASSWEVFVCDDCKAGKELDPLVIPNYRLAERIGQGAYGPIYRAEHTGMKRAALVKFIAPERAVDPKIMQLFIREAAIGGKLCHPNIIEMYDAGEQNGVYFIIEEWVNGTDLLRLIELQGAIPADEMVFIAQRVGEALKFAFHQGVVHRNVKPSGIFLGRHAGTVKLGDFGLAKSLYGQASESSSKITGPGELKGTPNYVAPEQLVDAAKADQRADLYSLGATLYHMACGRPPYDAASQLKVVRRIGENDLTPLQDLAPHLQKPLQGLIAKAMEREPARRFQTPDEMLAEIERIRTKLGIAPRPPEVA